MVIYNKAIRDNIPEIIKNSGNSSVVKNLSDEKFLVELEKKLKEEVEEYLENKSVEELTDPYYFFIFSNSCGISS